MTRRAVLVIHLAAHELAGHENVAKALGFVQGLVDEGESVTILASSETAEIYAKLPVIVWPDGAPRGVLRLLALVRRISWGEFTAIHDLENSRRTRAYRWFIRPCPPWYLSP